MFEAGDSDSRFIHAFEGEVQPANKESRPRGDDAAQRQAQTQRGTSLRGREVVSGGGGARQPRSSAVLAESRPRIKRTLLVKCESVDATGK